MSRSGFVLPGRATDAWSREVGDDVVIVDSATERAHALSGLAAEVWRASETGEWTGPISANFHEAVDQLIDAGLLLPQSGMSRRTMLKRTGTVAAGVGIASIALPMANAAASVTASITLTPGTGPRGTVVTLSGSGFPASTLITVTFNGVTIATTPSTVTTTAGGAIPAGVTFVVPDAATLGATNTVSVVAGAASASATFTVTTPTLTLQNSGGTTVTSGPKQVLTVSGSGYAATSTLTIKFDGTTVGTATSSATGAIPSGTTFTVPAGATVAGHTVTVTDAHTNVGTITYTVVAPTIGSLPATLPRSPGATTPQSVTISGSGFAPSTGGQTCARGSTSTLRRPRCLTAR
jgi:hypothetical protein